MWSVIEWILSIYYQSKVTECGRQRSKVKILLLQRYALGAYHVIDGQNTRYHIMSDRRSKRSWSDCILCIRFIPSGSPSEATYVPCMRNSNLEIRITCSSFGWQLNSSRDTFFRLWKLMSSVCLFVCFFNLERRHPSWSECTRRREK